MNVFVLNTGRCGSSTFIEACGHIENFTAGHESRLPLTGAPRLAYPTQHIEADNRLSWLLGRLESAYGDKAFYVHLSRDRDATARSFAKRGAFGIMQAYRQGLLLGGEDDPSMLDVAYDYIDTVEANIELFLRNKPLKMAFGLETAKRDFAEFWRRIEARGKLEQALAEWDTVYNGSD